MTNHRSDKHPIADITSISPEKLLIMHSRLAIIPYGSNRSELDRDIELVSKSIASELRQAKSDTPSLINAQKVAIRCFVSEADPKPDYICGSLLSILAPRLANHPELNDIAMLPDRLLPKNWLDIGRFAMKFGLFDTKTSNGLLLLLPSESARSIGVPFSRLEHGSCRNAGSVFAVSQRQPRGYKAISQTHRMFPGWRVISMR